ncbi:MAG: hypothetical protein ACKOGH_07015 [Alphaproteobacteria bacterium]
MAASREGHPGARDLVAFRDPDEALGRVQALYAAAADGIRARLARFAAGAPDVDLPAAAYPYVGIDVPAGALNIDARVAYGAALDAGSYASTLTRPDLFASYYRDQFRRIVAHHGVELLVGTSDRPIPLPFVAERAVEGIAEPDIRALQQVFALPDLSCIDDSIATGAHRPPPGSTKAW